MFFQKMKSLIAVSGGVDSMVLLNQYKDKEVKVVHINHNTRGQENKKEEEMVMFFCQKNNIEFFRFDYFHKEGNFHKKAREFRYKTFSKIVKEKKLDCVILAHHFDDQIENIIMNPKKIGNKIMKDKDYINDVLVYRPMLNLTKDEIYKYAKDNNVSYMEDSSNQKDCYLRNRTRKKLKIYSKEEKKRIYKKEIDRIKKLELIKEKLINKDISDKDLTTKEDVYVFLKINGINSNISLNKINDILDFLKNKKNGKIQIQKDIFLENSYHKIKLKKTNKQISEGKKKLENGENKFNLFIFYSDLNAYVRSYKDGDKIKLKNGSKKITRFFIDQKIPKEYRNLWPVIVDDADNIIRVLKKEEVKIKEI